MSDNELPLAGLAAKGGAADFLRVIGGDAPRATIEVDVDGPIGADSCRRGAVPRPLASSETTTPSLA